MDTHSPTPREPQTFPELVAKQDNTIAVLKEALKEVCDELSQPSVGDRPSVIWGHLCRARNITVSAMHKLELKDAK